MTFNRSELLDYYYRDLYPELELLEKERKEILKKLKFAILVIAPFALVLMFKLSNENNLAVEIPIVAISIFSLVAVWLSRDYKRTFKKRIVSRLISKIAPSLRYDSSGKIPESIFRMSALFEDDFSRYEGGDLIEGEIDGIPIKASYLRVQKSYRDSNGRKRERTIFSGIFIVTEFHKRFRHTTRVVPDISEKYLGLFGEWIQKLAAQKLVRMDSPAFEKEFKVYSDDSIEAHYLLTPNIMERLVKMKKRANAPLYISFRLRKLFIAIEKSSDPFKPSLFRFLLDIEIFKRYMENLNLILGIVETLNLDRKIWSKE